MYPAFGKPLALVLLLMFPSTLLCLSTEQITFHEEYCHGSVEDTGYQGGVSPSRNDSDSFFGFHGAFFTGGAPFFNGNATLFSLKSLEKFAFLAIHNTTSSTEQERPRILVDASLLLRNRSRFWFPESSRDSRHARARRDPFERPGGVRFTLKGVWSPHSGVLCMSGCVIQDNRPQSTGSDCKVKAFFRYPLVNNIRQSLVKGTIQSMRDMSDPLYFSQVFITALYEAPFVFKEADETGAMVNANVPPHVKVWKDDSAVCEFPWFKQPLTISWDKQCSGQDCSPFKAVGPTTVSTLAVENEVCSGRKVHGFFIFESAPSMPTERRFSTMYDVSGIEGGWNDVLAVEGVWNSTTGQLSALGCYLEGVTNSSLEFTSKDCDIVINLQFPITLELTFRYSVVGRIARKAGSTLTPFRPFLFTGHLDMSYGPFGWSTSPPQLEYVYTAEKIMHATSECQSGSPSQLIKSKVGKTNLTYPDGQKFNDLAFVAIFKVSSTSASLRAQFSPLSINERTNMDLNPSWDDLVSSTTSHEKGSLKISFEINFFNLLPDIKLMNYTDSSQFPAEGIYDPNKGLLCLIACRSLSVSKAQGMSKLYDGDKDCEMHITVHFPPANPGFLDKQHVSGQISSLRDKKDALYFSPIDITSDHIFYQVGAEQFLRQIDLEIVVGVISLTMAFLFIGLQLHHVKKYPKVLPQISLLMLFILILAHLIPLVLNFEAVFMKAYPQNVLSWSGGWLEINEALVRLMTMVVFLMLVRLLYLSWVSKCESMTGEGCWKMEKNLFRVCLITYGLAGLITMIINSVMGSNFLDLLKLFSGLTVDFFLFPQVIGNYVWETHGRILSCPFYIGMTFVRIVPYVHDIVRKLDFFWIIHRRSVYVDPKWDTYSNVWDVTIPCGSLLLAILVFCQQRYGGAFFSPASWRQRRVYKQISMSPI